MDCQQLVHHTVELLKGGEAIIFLSAGASVGDGTERGAPSSHELRQAIIDRFKLTPGNGSDLETVATIAADEFGEPAVKKHVAATIMDRST